MRCFYANRAQQGAPRQRNHYTKLNTENALQNMFSCVTKREVSLQQGAPRQRAPHAHITTPNVCVCVYVHV